MQPLENQVDIQPYERHVVMTLVFVVILILVGLAAIFILQNVAPVEVTFLLWSLSMSRALLVFFTFVLGLLSGWFLHSYFRYRKAKKELPGKFNSRSMQRNPDDEAGPAQ